MKPLLFPVLVLLAAQAGAQGYFQQKADTRIDVLLDDRTHMLHGFETISYTNNSPDTLRFIYLHLWPNAYSSDRTLFARQQVANGTTAFYYSKTADRGYIDSLAIRVDGIPVPAISATDTPDIARIDLISPLPPGGTMQLSTPFRVKIPLVFSRLGHKGQAYYISQWFPKPAVYDRKGWHPLPYTDQGEFYSEIGSYDVTITLPKNYVVMATGNCVMETENAWLDSLSRLPLPLTDHPGSRLKKWRNRLDRIPPSASEWKTLRFVEDKIHDFALFADKRFVVRKDTVHVAAGAGAPAHEVTIYTAFLPSGARNWKESTDYLKTTVRQLSEEVGPYPYKTIKAVEGELSAGGGMEYPTVALIDRFGSSTTVRTVIAHEAGHNWFYGILASNERDHPWMDEGFNTFYEQKIAAALSNREEKISPEDILYYNAAGTRADQPLSSHSFDYTEFNYGLDAYYKSALMLRWLEGYMGADSFRAAMQDYYGSWRHRHPYPEDLEPIFQRHTPKPVGWFFNDALKTGRGIDFGLKKVRTTPEGTAIRIRNRSGFAAPVRVEAMLQDSITGSMWSLPFLRDTTILLANTGATSWRIAADEVPDYYGLNNRYRSFGLLRGTSVKVRSGLGIGRQEAAELYLLPAIGYNVYDGFMAGLLLHNFSVPQHRFRFVLAPMYGFRSGALAGGGSIGYWIYPKSFVRELVPQVDIKSFHYDSSSMHIPSVLRARYLKIAPSLSFGFKNASPRSTVTRTLLMKGYTIWEERLTISLDPIDSLLKPTLDGKAPSNYCLLRYKHLNERTFNPFSYALEAQIGPGFAKLTAEGRLRIEYPLKDKALHLRGFAGKYIDMGGDQSRYWLTTTYTAANDYLYDGMYLGRSEEHGFLSRQVGIQEGGGKLPTSRYSLSYGHSDDWLAGINIKSDLPLRGLPLRLYFDASTYAGAHKASPSGSRFLYTGGIELYALRDIFLLHIPLVMSPDYRAYLNSIYPGKAFANSISFSVQLQNVNWLRTVSTAMKYIGN